MKDHFHSLRVIRPDFFINPGDFIYHGVYEKTVKTMVSTTVTRYETTDGRGCCENDYVC